MYLDLNHWIELAKVATGHSTGEQHRGALEACRAAQQSGSAIFPLSGTHYMEMYGIQDPRQRRDVGEVMEELSGFATLLPRDALMKLELDAVLTERAGPRPNPLPALPLLGRGVAWAMGRQGGLRIRSPEGDVTERIREQWPGGPAGFDTWRADAERQMERYALWGPEDADIAALRGYGYDPDVAKTVAERRAEEERALGRRLTAEPRWPRGRLRDVVAQHEVVVELFEAVAEALDARGLEIADVWRDHEALRAIVDRMPSTEVAVTLKTHAHRNADKGWLPNDVFDIDALSVAVPYCDVVVTERHAHHVLTVSGTDRRAETVVLRRLSDLSTALGD